MRIELGFQGYGQAEIKEVNDCLNSGNLTMGKRVWRFERMFAHYVGAKHAIMVNSGSSANLLAVAALAEAGILKAESRVYAPALTWPTTVWPLVQYGVNVHLMDCDARTLCSPMVEKPDDIGFSVHVLGNGAESFGFLEDCCEALGTRRNGVHVGVGALAATFSFFYSHHMTTVEGGMVITGDDDLADIMRSMRAHGWTRGTRQEGIAMGGLDPRFLFVHPGYNLRPTEIQAAFGIHQIRKVEGWNAHRRQVYAAMRARLEPFGLFDFIEPTQGSDPAWFAFPVLVRNGKRRAIAAHLEGSNIQTRPILAGNLARHPAFAEHKAVTWNGLINADRVMADGIYWGCHPGINDAQIEYLVGAVESFMDRKDAA